MKRKIVHIDEEKCNGCGICVPACQEGAIKIENGKAKLVAENLCDGLGDCLNECPEGAITIEEREAEPFDEKAVEEHISSSKTAETSFDCQNSGELPCGCPSSQVKTIERMGSESKKQHENGAPMQSFSYLNQWPIQLALLPPKAQFFEDAELLISADCVPFAFGNFHPEFLKGKTLVIGCPKLDNAEMYVDKLTQIFSQNNIKSITMVYMEIPCCTGLKHIVENALLTAEKDIPLEEYKVSLEGKAEFIT